MIEFTRREQAMLTLAVPDIPTDAILSADEATILLGKLQSVSELLSNVYILLIVYRSWIE